MTEVSRTVHLQRHQVHVEHQPNPFTREKAPPCMHIFTTTCLNVSLLCLRRHQQHDMLITTTMTSFCIFSTVPTHVAWAQQVIIM